ncbi:MAG: DNA polymerase I [Bdellovibrionales bacterium]|nr:DNA polymerase I [Bdellovibrionales bacterium]
MGINAVSQGGKLYLVDVSSLFFRAYYAISSHLSSPKGLPTNALYGLLSMTDKFIRESKSEYIVYCFDHEKPSFRVDIYPEYKANRGEIPEDLKVQIPYIKKLVSSLGIPMVEQVGYEADDLIGSLAMIAQKKGFKVVVVSGDKDFAQIVSSSVSLYDPMKEINYDSAGVQQKWGVRPDQINDYLAIVGDSSDNIPGVFGIGPKGAQKLLKEYDSLEQIYENLDSIQQKTAEKLRHSKKEAFLSQKLARIVTDVDLKENRPSFQRQPIQIEALRDLLKELGFKTFEKKLCPSLPIKTEEVRFVSSPQKIKKLSSNLRLHRLEWDELKPFIQPYGKVWCFLQGGQYFLAYKNKVITLENHNLHKVGQFFSDRRVYWSGYDLKKIWKDFNCRHPLPYWCAMIAAYLVESSPPGGFEKVCLKYTGEAVDHSLAPGEVYQLHKKLNKDLKKQLKERNMLGLYEKVELALISVLYNMEKKGIMLDPLELDKQAREVNQKIKMIEQEIFDYVKHEFNISSPKQLADVLFTELGLSPLRKTKTGYSTDMDVLNKLRAKHPVIPLVLEHRELFKLKTTYIEALPPLINKETNRIHTHFRQALTATGRLSSINPNLQNIPIKTERGRKIRKAFVAPKGKKIISADYSQIELRILAHITEDPMLCSAFERDWDIHKATASEIYSVPVEGVTEQMRRSAKAINFGLIYGQGAYTLSESLGVSVSEASDIIKNYFTRFKRVKEYMDSVVVSAHKKGYVETFFSRRRTIRELSSSRVQIKKWGERMAINTPIQGTASDLVKIAMIELSNSLYSPLLLQIHDELLFECDEDRIQEETWQIKNIMENVVAWKVPLKVHIHVGQNWQAAHS